MIAPIQPAAGMLFGEFRIVRPLSAGGMGAVYIAEQASTGKLRALKLMHPQLCADTRLRERFEQEARVGALVESDHIVQVIGAGIDPANGVPWLAMELLEGEDLAQRMKRCGLLPPQEVHEIFRQLCHALGAAHRAGVVHRDMKPQNVFLARTHSATAPWSVKVLDFGIAKIAAEASTMATASLGTPLWMAPEQTDTRGQIAPATDVWALGLIAFAMLTGRTYWRAANDPMGTAMPVLLREILFEPIDPASTRATALGSVGSIVHPFDAWFARCLAREPSERFQTAQEAFDALGPALFADPRSARPAGAASSAAPPGIAAAAVTSAGTASRLSMTGPTEVAADAQRPPSAAPGARWGAPSPSQPADRSRQGASSAPASAPALASSAPAGALRRPARWRPVLLLAGGLLGGAAAAAALAFATGRTPRDVELVQRLPAPARPTVVSAGRGDGARPPAAGADGADAQQPAPGPRNGLVPLPKAPRPSREGGAPAPSTTAPPSAARPFDHAAAHAALQRKGSTAPVHCKGREGPKAVTARVFFNPAGAVQRIGIDPRVAMTPAGSCVHMVLGSTRVPPFDGNELQEVSTTVAIE